MEQPIFNILDYRDSIEQRLARLASRYQSCFAIWCLHSMRGSWGSRAFASLNETAVGLISGSIDVFWENVLADTRPAAGLLLNIQQQCEAIDTDGLDDVSETLLSELVGGLLAVVDGFLTGSPEQSMLLADYAINCIDVDLGERTGISPAGDISTVPEIAAELRAQGEMIRYLEGSPKLIPEDISRFRKG